jgi:hypothetical protein
VILFFVPVLCLIAQDEDGDSEEEKKPPIDSRWQESSLETFAKGDVAFNINIGVIFPVAFTVGSLSQYSPPVGGSGSLSVSYFLNSHVFTGGGIQGMFTPTIGEHMLYIVPMGAHIGYVWTAGRFEFPLLLTAGWAWQMYLEHLYFGFFAQPQFSALFRTFNNWSFGITAAWWILPQWGTNTTDDTGKTIAGKDAIGNFLTLTLIAQYHF